MAPNQAKTVNLSVAGHFAQESLCAEPSFVRLMSVAEPCLHPQMRDSSFDDVKLRDFQHVPVSALNAHPEFQH